MVAPEWRGENQDDSLLVQVQISKTGETEKLHDLLRNMNVAIHVDQSACLLHIVSNGNKDNFLIKLNELLAIYNGERDESEQAEIIETRRVKQSFCGAGGKTLLDDNQPLETPPGSGSRWPSLSLEAGRSFGTGTHPSTLLVIRFLKDHIGRPFPEKVLDIGCGSGILSLMSARFGARRVVGIDICHHSVIVARQNVIRNNVADTVTITDTPLQDVKDTFHLILANLAPSVLHCLHTEMQRLCPSGGKLIVSGLQGSAQADEMTAMFLKHQWREDMRLSEGKWQAILLTRE